MKYPYSLTIRGKHKTWGFIVYVDPQYIDEWRADGVEIDGPILYSIPGWVVAYRLTWVWMFFTDIFNFRNPFRQ